MRAMRNASDLVTEFRKEISEIRAMRKEFHIDFIDSGFLEFSKAFEYLYKYPVLIAKNASGRGLPLHMFYFDYEEYKDDLIKDERDRAYKLIEKIEKENIF